MQYASPSEENAVAVESSHKQPMKKSFLKRGFYLPMVSQYRTILRLTVLACASLGISQVYGATTLTATSSSVNSGKTDQFTQPAVALSVSPNMTTLGPSGNTQFTPTVSYASNK